VNVIDQISKLWHDFLAFLATIIIPDWPGLIALLPVFVVLGLVGPLATLFVLGLLGYNITKPRVKVRYAEGGREAPRDHLGRPIAPSGEPYCPRDGLIYPFGAQRCDRDKAELLLRCPKCDVVRTAGVHTCPNCGLTIKLQPRTMVVVHDAPPPGGAAVA